MAVYNFICTNKECTEYEIKYSHVQFSKADVKTCSQCGDTLTRVFPTSVNVKSSIEINNQPVGKVIEEKNTKLKNMWGAYSHEQQSLKDKIHKMAEERSK